MKQREARVFLFEIHRACDLVLQFTSGMSLSEYGSDVKTRSAVERQLEIVGEAMGQMLKSFPEMQQDFPEAPRIIAFRNYLIHGYASVSNEVVWGIVEAHLPGLASRVGALLAEELP
jgi:uncharacterized protein with HEPN domain